jgi:putative sigma-54 modulation protein
VELQITARHADVNESLRTYASDKLGGLSRYHKGLRLLEVVLGEESLDKTVEVIAHLARGAPVVVSARHADSHASIDLAHDKLERVLKREKERRRDLARQRGAQPGAPTARGPGAQPGGGGED